MLWYQNESHVEWLHFYYLSLFHPPPLRPGLIVSCMLRDTEKTFIFLQQFCILFFLSLLHNPIKYSRVSLLALGRRSLTQKFKFYRLWEFFFFSFAMALALLRRKQSRKTQSENYSCRLCVKVLLHIVSFCVFWIIFSQFQSEHTGNFFYANFLLLLEKSQNSEWRVETFFFAARKNMKMLFLEFL